MGKKQIYSILDKLKKNLGVWTDKELCEKVDWKYGTLDTWKRRDKIPTSRIYEVAKKFDLGVEELLDPDSNVVRENSPTPYNATKSNNNIKVAVVNVKASAGSGVELEGVEDFKSSKFLELTSNLFKVSPGTALYALQVDGDSMVPKLLPDSWVVFRECGAWEGDGLYVFNYNNTLFVKTIEVNPENGNLYIKSENRNYSSWEYDPTTNNSAFKIVGRVVRSIV